MREKRSKRDFSFVKVLLFILALGLIISGAVIVQASRAGMNIGLLSPGEGSVFTLNGDETGKNIWVNVSTNEDAICRVYSGLCDKEDSDPLTACFYSNSENLSTSFSKYHSKNIFAEDNEDYTKHVFYIECKDKLNQSFNKRVYFYFNYSDNFDYLKECVPNIVNTSWSEWENISCSHNDKMHQKRSLVQYDENECEGYENETFKDYRETKFCDFCTPLIVESLWSEWENISCMDNDKMNQSRYLTQYDTRDCGEFEDVRVYQYKEEINCKNPVRLLILSPNKEIYNTTNVLISVSSKEEFSKIEYIDKLGQGTAWTVLCTYCSGSSKLRVFQYGNHSLVFNGILENGSVITNQTSFIVDNRRPQISAIKPVSMRHTNGSEFYIKYTEDNCEELKLIINDEEVKSGECLSGKYIIEAFSQDLSEYDGQYINYQFRIRDIAGNTVISRITKVRVDTTSPEISDFQNKVLGRYVTFNMSILNEDKLSFYRVEYLDNATIVPQWRPLCSSMINTNRCYKKMYLSGGAHEIKIRVKDKAGNSDEEIVELNMPVMTNLIG